jgi:hypothetical protein
MDPIELLAILGMITTPLSIGLLAAWLSARKEARLREELMREMRYQAPERGADARRLQETVESLAVEIERLGEGQRFTARLLADRANADRHIGAGSPPRTITPH